MIEMPPAATQARHGREELYNPLLFPQEAAPAVARTPGSRWYTCDIKRRPTDSAKAAWRL